MSTSDFTPAEDETLISRLVDEAATDDEKTRLVELLESEAAAQHIVLGPLWPRTTFGAAMNSERP